MRYLLLLSLLLLVTGCCGWRGSDKVYEEHFEKPTEEQLEELNYPGLVDVIFGYAVELKYKKQMLLKQSCAVFDSKLERVRLRFAVQHLLELQEGRKMLVELVEGLLDRINNHVGIHACHANRRFTADDLEIVIEFESFFSLFVDPTYMGRIDMRDGEVVFSDASIYNKSYDSWGCKREPYLLTRQLVAIEDRVGGPYLEEELRRETLFPQRYIYEPTQRY